ncbi:MAG: hypothetical protein DRN90_05895, partial [Thermoproteota archaeon]
MSREKRLILWFEETNMKDVPLVGGKSASLGEMTAMGLPVPPGFSVTAYAYERFLKEMGIAEKVYEIIEEVVGEDKTPAAYEEAS